MPNAGSQNRKCRRTYLQRAKTRSPSQLDNDAGADHRFMGQIAVLNGTRERAVATRKPGDEPAARRKDHACRGEDLLDLAQNEMLEHIECGDHVEFSARGDRLQACFRWVRLQPRLPGALDQLRIALGPDKSPALRRNPARKSPVAEADFKDAQVPVEGDARALELGSEGQRVGMAELAEARSIPRLPGAIFRVPRLVTLERDVPAPLAPWTRSRDRRMAATERHRQRRRPRPRMPTAAPSARQARAAAEPAPTNGPIAIG